MRMQRLCALICPSSRIALLAMLCLSLSVHAQTADKNVTALPFHASPIDNRFVLTDWNISNSNAQELYTIERSSDGVHFETAGYVRGEYSNAPVINYSFIDEDPYNGLSYYRVKTTHSDKSVTYSAPVSVQVSKLQFKLYPNPAMRNGTVNLSVQNNQSQEIVLQLFDMSGARVLNKIMQLSDGQNSLQLPLEGVSAGVYTLTLSSETFFEKHTLTVQ